MLFKTFSICHHLISLHVSLYSLCKTTRISRSTSSLFLFFSLWCKFVFLSKGQWFWDIDSDTSMLGPIFAGTFLSYSSSDLVVQLLLCMPHCLWFPKHRGYSHEIHVNTMQDVSAPHLLQDQALKRSKKLPLMALSVDLGTPGNKVWLPIRDSMRKKKKKKSFFTKHLPDWLRLFWTLSVAHVKNGPFTKNTLILQLLDMTFTRHC